VVATFSVIIREKGGAERRETFDRTEISVGRVEGNDLVLPDGNVSKRHARLLYRDGRFVVTDLQSANGTYVNGRKITQATIVREGDKIYIGAFMLRIEAGTGSAWYDVDPDASRPAPPLRPIAAPPPPSPGMPSAVPLRPPCSAPGEDAPLGAVPPPYAARRCQPAPGEDDPLEAAFSRLDRGCFAVDAPAEMTVGLPEVLSASAIRDYLKRDVLEITRRRGIWLMEEALLSRRLRVELIADRGEDFTVRALSLAEQPLIGEEITLWEWLVTPHVAGERQALRVLATNLLDVAGERIGKSHPVKTIVIQVHVGVGAQATASPAGPSRAALRRMLSQILRSSSDLEAFCLDHFTEVHDRFTDGMDRVARFNLLLSRVDGPAILAALRVAHPEALALHQP
jgi:hypothetical protein